MLKVAVFVLADTESHGDLGRLVNALIAVKELKEAGDTGILVFAGAGTKWPVELSRSDHLAHPLYEAVRENVAGVCRFCAGAFEVEAEIAGLGMALIDEFDHHPSLRTYLSEGYQVITF